jgi:hypothetical protein
MDVTHLAVLLGAVLLAGVATAQPVVVRAVNEEDVEVGGSWVKVGEGALASEVRERRVD